MNIHLKSVRISIRNKQITKIKVLISITMAIISTVIIHACSSAVYHKGDTQMSEIEDSPHYKEGKFKNYVDWEQPSFGEYLSTGWEFLFGGDQRTPDGLLPQKTVDLKHFTDPGTDQLNVTWLGHSSLMINIDGYKIMTDPVFEKSVSFFGPSRYNISGDRCL